LKLSIQSNLSRFPVPAIFLDRDGTINVDKDYLYKISDWEWIPGAQQAIQMLQNEGFKIIIVSNQSGIARGFFSVTDVDELHSFIRNDLDKLGIHIDGFFYCPHHPNFSDRCECRKPSPFMLLKAKELLNLDLESSWIIGDRVSDMQCGIAAGVKPLFVKTGHGLNELAMLTSDIKIFESVKFAADYIINKSINK
jgi:D-glycero-D-manno-heptose 1,7-bisphosphate phosphatase